ncbi:class I SAM-dependent methyltransferase family protein [Candidatus Woesearchaeota archaeon]|nr:class I SAM-dependent methyltransferase family protein [Candidatus Woesearchaeota archaeon]MBI2582614.1 class I SAM-dependent methyltransferase family protein [Candidatus Woesearchaeota archaeon]
MLAAYTELRYAEKVKQFLLKKGLLHQDHLPVKELDHIFFAMHKKVTVPNAKVVNTKFSFPERQKPTTVDQLLKGKLTAKELELLPRTQELVGEILILEIPNELKKKENIIAEAYLKVNKQVSTVVKKSDSHSGQFRTRKVTVLAGNKTKETIHRENGIELKLHLEKTYFSARTGSERLRIAKLVKPGEEVLVMFSGAAPFPLVIAKNSEARHIYGVELNPDAHTYAMENVLLNDLQDKITIIHGDVKHKIPPLKKKFDRIAMPLPKTGEQFLDLALLKVKKGGFIHLYAFLDEKDIDPYAKKIREICKKLGYSIKVSRKVKCGQFSPGVFRVCLDLKLL